MVGGTTTNKKEWRSGVEEIREDRQIAEGVIWDMQLEEKSSYQYYHIIIFIGWRLPELHD
jgi:hypothetical protein